ncbi:DUF348 domain-containing protein [Alloscardovia theropitheci]|uniref:DUF348 domain-containing protein n=1 Tax=Alloscardovia theropitheci TaxID=2496842 RepID=A0A4R0QS88_9BIFI|nr:ubiquitin-like domain-containing protein [Alloscardovia theropitheci]TCD54278.1 DUF348 domain-containing protein [Alloscardovia theropitheci]
MALRWTPKRFIMHRRWRIIITAIISLMILLTSFFVGVYKSVALTVNGKTTHVRTFAISVNGLLAQENIPIKTHDFVSSRAGARLINNDSVIVRSAYEASITIDGHEVPFWTYATSADQLLKLFKQNEANAVKVTVNISNIYNKLTGGFVINSDGPVTVIADGQTTTMPDGKLTAASILDARGINLGQHDRVSVEQSGSDTILRVVRISYSDSTRDVEIPYTSLTINDDTMDEGTTTIVQQGANGSKTQYLRNTIADGVVESSEITKEIVTRDPQDEIIHVGTKKKADDSDASSHSSDTDNSAPSNDSQSQSSQQDQTQSQSQSQAQSQNQSQSNDQAQAQEKAKAEAAEKAKRDEEARKAADEAAQRAREQAAQQQQAQQQAQSGLWHPTVAQAKAYAQAAAAQYGWTGSNWSALEWLWNRESSWRWNAENRSSGAYGIPQSLPGSKMAAYGANWRDDAAIQINWGLNYIKNRYGSPLKAQEHSKNTGWY